MVIMTKSFKNLVKNYLILIGLVAIPLTLFFLSPSLLDNNKSVCLSVVFFDQECYGCGMGRALFKIMHFEFEEAYYYNALSFIVFPLLVFVWATELFKNIKELKKK
jgi:NADH:ubiquinone oxidoreductase subunit 3 (subunit A)